MGRCYEAFEKKQKLDINKENLHLTSHLTSEKYEHLNTSDKVSRCKKITTQMLKILFSMVWASVYSSSLVHWSLASFISTACPRARRFCQPGFNYQKIDGKCFTSTKMDLAVKKSVSGNQDLRESDPVTAGNFPYTEM